jgi:hypothetical protein
MASHKPLPSIDDHEDQGQLPIVANRVYIKDTSINIYLTYDQAVQTATNLLKKAELIKDHPGTIVQLWTVKGSSKLNFGLNNIVKKGKQEAWH